MFLAILGKQMKFEKSRITLLFISLIGFLVLLFVSIKAGSASFTHDESFSYLHYSNQSFMQLISFSDWYTNNHILNSILMKYSEVVFGNSEFALRLPNLILLLVYMLYSYRLFKDKGNVLKACMFILLCSNVLLMDLFGLARGYGLSCGFMMLCIFHFISYVKENKRTDLFIFHLAALLASLSNFTMVTVYLALLIILNLWAYINHRVIIGEKFSFIKTNKAHGIPFLLAVIVLYEPLRRVLSYCKLDFGGKKGFFEDTVSSLITNTFHNVTLPSPMMILLNVMFALVVFVSFFVIIMNTLKKEKEFIKQFVELIILNFLILLVSMGIVLQHIVFKSDYPIARFSMYLFPLFMLHLGYTVHYFSTLKYRKIIMVKLCIFSFISAISFCAKANLHFCAEWSYDSETKNMMLALKTDVEKSGTPIQKIKLGNNWLFEPTINYYRKKYKMDWLLEADRAEVTGKEDYFYLFREDLNKIRGIKYHVVTEFKSTKTLLIKNNYE